MTVWGQLADRASGKYSQAGEEGILTAIFSAIGTTNRYAVEFGAGDGFTYSNTRRLRELGWGGLMLEGDPKHANDMVKTEFITRENINDVLARWRVPPSFDLLSIDIDGNDWYVWQALVPRARVVVIEFNRMWPEGESVTIEYDPAFHHDGTDYHGASYSALRKLGHAKGYVLVHHQGVNLFFVARECLALEGDGIQPPPFSPVIGHPPDMLRRRWVTV